MIMCIENAISPPIFEFRHMDTSCTLTLTFKGLHREVANDHLQGFIDVCRAMFFDLECSIRLEFLLTIL